MAGIAGRPRGDLRAGEASVGRAAILSSMRRELGDDASLTHSYIGIDFPGGTGYDDE